MAKLKITKKIVGKPSDRFWHDSMMRVLTVLYFQEATWARNYWADYGISVADTKKIEKEFDRWLANGRGTYTEAQINQAHK